MTPGQSQSQPIDLLAIARMEERRQAEGTASLADENEAIAGGTISFAGPGSWANQACGLGLAGPVSAQELDHFVDFYESRGVAPQIEVTPFADASLVKGLADRRFLLRGMENVLVRDLRQPLPPMPPGVEVAAVDGRDEAQVEQYIDIFCTGFGIANREAYAYTERRMLVHPDCRPFFGLIDGQRVAVGSCEARPPIGGLFGMTTLAPFRGRGVQRAIMLARMAACRDNGCDWISVHADPHVATGRNALRLGFFVAYTKVILYRPGDGLVPSP